jgi:hypothetical protein
LVYAWCFEGRGEVAQLINDDVSTPVTQRHPRTWRVTPVFSDHASLLQLHSIRLAANNLIEQARALDVIFHVNLRERKFYLAEKRGVQGELIGVKHVIVE